MSCIDSNTKKIDRDLNVPDATAVKINRDSRQHLGNFKSRWALLKIALLPLAFLAACTTSGLVTPPAQPYPPFAVSKWEMLPDWQPGGHPVLGTHHRK